MHLILGLVFLLCARIEEGIGGRYLELQDQELLKDDRHKQCIFFLHIKCDLI